MEVPYKSIAIAALWLNTRNIDTMFYVPWSNMRREYDNVNSYNGGHYKSIIATPLLIDVVYIELNSAEIKLVHTPPYSQLATKVQCKLILHACS